MTKKKENIIYKSDSGLKAPEFVNGFGIIPSDETLMLDFGFIGPSYYGKHEDELTHVARIVMDWDVAEGLCDNISECINLMKEEKEEKEEKKSKKKRPK